MNEKQEDEKENSGSEEAVSDINYREIAWQYVERANQNPDEWFEVSDYLEGVSQRLGYDLEQVKAHRVGLELMRLKDNLFQSKNQIGSSAKIYRFAPWRDTYREEGVREELKEKLVEVLAEEEDKLTPLGVRANYEEELGGAHVIAIKRALDELTEEEEARKSRVMYKVTQPQEGVDGTQASDPTHIDNSAATESGNISQELREIASQLDEDELPEDICQVDSGFFRGLGSIKRRDVDKNYAERNIKTYRGAEDHQREIMMEIAGELVELARDSVLEENRTAEIDQLLDDNFPQEKLSKLEAAADELKQ